MDVRAHLPRGGGRPLSILLAVVGLALLIGCAGDSAESLRGDDAMSPETTTYSGYVPEGAAGADTAEDNSKSGGITPQPGGFENSSSYPVSASTERMIVSNASLLVEVARGQFQIAFDQALLLADKYGGYVVSSSSNATGDEDLMRTGTVSLRVPSGSFSQALTDASKLGTVMSRDIDSQDVTEEYLDLEARLKNAEAQEKALLDLMNKADTIDEILQVRQYLSQTQMEIEQLKGRMRFLEEHTSYSTLTLSLYEVGAEVSSTGEWGFTSAIEEALHAFVDSINSMIVFVGGAVPVLVILALIAWLVYRSVRPRVGRTRGGRAGTRGEEQAGGGNAAAPRPDAAVDPGTESGGAEESGR